MDLTFVHYGATEFDFKKFEPIKNRVRIGKPYGGFWASPIGAKYGWENWCEDEDFRYCNIDNAFVFKLFPDANVIVINSVDDAKRLPEILNDWWYPNYIYPDFEQLVSNGVDAILLNFSNSAGLYQAMYGWDCDSLLVMNPHIIRTISPALPHVSS